MFAEFLKVPVSILALACGLFAADDKTPPSPQKIVVVVLENHDYQQIVGDGVNAPFLNGLIAQGVLFTNAHAVDHPSQPNYLALFSGSDQGVNNRTATATNALDFNILIPRLKAALADPSTPRSLIPILQGQLTVAQAALAAGVDPRIYTGDAFPGAGNFRLPNGAAVSIPFTTPNLGAQVLQAGKTFTEYVEGLSDAGAADASGYAVISKINNPADPYVVGYAHRHDPASNWLADNPTGNQLPRTAVQDFANFAAQNTDFSYLPNLAFVIPNTINDMHDGAPPSSTRLGDAWCKKNLANYVAWAKTHNSLLIVTTDESDQDRNNRIVTFVVGDPRIVGTGVSGQYLSHYDLMRSIQSMLGTAITGPSWPVVGMNFAGGQIVVPDQPAPPVVTRTIAGTSGGSSYQFLVPTPWNGQLILYAHGYVDRSAPIALPNTALEVQLFQAMANQGFAVAMSSYSQNGWAVKEATADMRTLQDLFVSQVAKPFRTYIVGVSMGGLVTLNLAENSASRYDGALSLCGVVGGAPVQWRRAGDARVVFDYFFPGVLPGDLLHTPQLDVSVGGPVFNLVAAALAAGFAAPGNPSLQYASVMNLPGSSTNELIYSAFSLLSADYAELLQRTGGKNPYDNSQTVYVGSNNDDLLNSKVQRFKADPDGTAYLVQYYAPSGKLTIPVVTLHTTEDQTADFAHEAQYAALVRNAGAGSLLVQQSASRYGHCNFNPAEIVNAFSGLIGWVNFGIRPNGGNVTIP